MWQIKTSALFDKQLFEFAENYKQKADLETADRFLDCVDDSMGHIGKSPLSCVVYHELKKIEGLQEYEFRKWRVPVFPFSIFFRILDDEIILIEAIYAHRMDIGKRLRTERE